MKNSFLKNIYSFLKKEVPSIKFVIFFLIFCLPSGISGILFVLFPEFNISQIAKFFYKFRPEQFSAKKEEIVLPFAKELHKDWQFLGILKALDDLDVNVQREAVQKLAKYNFKSKNFSFVPVQQSQRQKIQMFLKDKDENLDVRRASINILANLGSKDFELISELLKLLKDPSKQVREEAAIVLGTVVSETIAVNTISSSEAEKLILELRELLENKNKVIREAAATAIGKIGSPVKELIPQLLKLLNDEDDGVRQAAAIAIGTMALEGEELIPQLKPLFEDKDWRVRHAAAITISTMGSEGEELIPQLKPLFKDKDWRVRRAAAMAISTMCLEAIELIPQLLNLLEDEDWLVREKAAIAVGKMRLKDKESIKKLRKLLRDEEESRVRSASVTALGTKVSEPKELISKLKDLLEDKDQSVCYAAVGVVSKIASDAEELIPNLRKLLIDDSNICSPKNEDLNIRKAIGIAISNIILESKELIPELKLWLIDDNNSNIKYAAAIAVGEMESDATQFISELLKLLQDENWDVSEAAAKSLGRIGSEDKKIFPRMQDLLENEDSNVRLAVIKALGEIGLEAKKFIPELIQRLNDEDSNVRLAAINTLANIEEEKLNTEQILQILNIVHKYPPIKKARVRFLAYLFSGGESDAIRSIKWLGSPTQYPYQNEQFISRKDGKDVLELFEKILEISKSANLEHLSSELEQQINIVVKKVDWQAEDITLIKKLNKNLNSENENRKAKTVSLELQLIQLLPYGKVMLIHPIIWFLLLYCYYPKSSRVQYLFWNPKIRRFAGLGYIGFLLTWIPFLRHRLFIPFKDILITDANLNSFNSQNYFSGSYVYLENDDSLPEPIKIAIDKVQSPTIIKGDSGLGKSMFLRYWTKSSKNLVVYLLAKNCSEGVITAIQKKIPIPQIDYKFLENLINKNTLKICVDGMNEATNNTCTKIIQFIKVHSRCHILLTTQHIDWNPPSSTKIYIIQRLKPEQILDFLFSRPFVQSVKNSIDKSKYKEACKEYVSKVFDSHKLLETEQEIIKELEQKIINELLSNPADLSIIAQIIAHGKKPDLLNIQQQQYEVMAKEYQKINFQSFPITEFAETLYEKRLDDEMNIPSEYKNELDCMEKYKMVYRKFYIEYNFQWYFRHETIREYFIVQAFMGQRNLHKLEKHMKDPSPRFRGIYLLLSYQFKDFKKILLNLCPAIPKSAPLEKFNEQTLPSDERETSLQNSAEVKTTNIYNSTINIDSHKENQMNKINHGLSIEGSEFKNNGQIAGGSNNKNQYETYTETQSKSLAEIAAEIQKLLKPFEESNPTNTTGDQMVVATKVIEIIESNFILKQQIVSVLQSVGTESFKNALDHPIAHILVAAFDGWTKP